MPDLVPVPRDLLTDVLTAMRAAQPGMWRPEDRRKLEAVALRLEAAMLEGGACAMTTCVR